MTGRTTFAVPPSVEHRFHVGRGDAAHVGAQGSPVEVTSVPYELLSDEELTVMERVLQKAGSPQPKRPLVN